MNYLWEVALQLDEKKLLRESISYVPAKICSPYIEAALTDLNWLDAEEGGAVEANPLYRFSSIFSGVFDADCQDYSQTRRLLFDVCMHYMIQLDLRQGLSREGYYMRFILRDILTGAYGAAAQEAMSLFSLQETHKILETLLLVFKNGDSLNFYKKVLQQVYANSLVYLSNDVFREILVYIGVEETETERKKMAFLSKMFLAKNYEIHLFWQHHFGILDVEDSMLLDDMALL